MMTDRNTIERVRAALGGEPRLAPDACPIAVGVEAGDLVLEAELPSVAAKKLALEMAAAVPGVGGIVDRLRVAPAERMGDATIRDHLAYAFQQEPVFLRHEIIRHENGRDEWLRRPDEPRGRLEFEVADGVVTLNGHVQGLDEKRLAGVLAWWMPGSRDVVNGIAVEPDEADNDIEIANAVRFALEKDPFVDSGQIRVWARDAKVTLQGLVPTPSEREMAEADAWYVFGVDDVRNEIEVRP